MSRQTSEAMAMSALEVSIRTASCCKDNDVAATVGVCADDRRKLSRMSRLPTAARSRAVRRRFVASVAVEAFMNSGTATNGQDIKPNATAQGRHPEGLKQPSAYQVQAGSTAFARPCTPQDHGQRSQLANHVPARQPSAPSRFSNEATRRQTSTKRPRSATLRERMTRTCQQHRKHVRNHAGDKPSTQRQQQQQMHAQTLNTQPRPTAAGDRTAKAQAGERDRVRSGQAPDGWAPAPAPELGSGSRSRGKIP